MKPETMEVVNDILNQLANQRGLHAEGKILLAMCGRYYLTTNELVILFRVNIKTIERMRRSGILKYSGDGKKNYTWDHVVELLKKRFYAGKM